MGALNVVYDKPFLARPTDGGASFEFISWLVARHDPYRAVMPAPVRLSPSDLVVALRRKSAIENWIDCFVSDDDGTTWSFLSQVGKTEDGNQFNGNPPRWCAWRTGAYVVPMATAAAARLWQG